MASGIDWFRWHHGSVTDPKFGLIAKKSGARVGDVISLWAFVLESASADEDRGTIGRLDFEAIEHLLNLDEGQAARILDAMTARGLIAGSRVANWEKRQPKREDDTAAERKRRQRDREAQEAAQEARDVTRCHDGSRDVTRCHDRGEERREEERTPSPPSPGGDGASAAAVAAGGQRDGTNPRARGTNPRAVDAAFDRWWAVYPKRVAKVDAEKAWRKLRPDSALVERIVSATIAAARCERWLDEGGRFIPYPATWLNRRSWEDEDVQPRRAGGAEWWVAAGYGTQTQAEADGVRAPA